MRLKRYNVLAIIFLLALSGFLSATAIGISPGDVTINTKQGETACANFTLIGNNKSLFLGEIKWSSKESRDIRDYNLTSEIAGINVTFEKSANEGKHVLCVSSEKQGIYSGVLMYRMEDSDYGVAMWVNVNIERNANFIQKLNINGEDVKENRFSAGNIVICIGLIAILAAIIFFAFRKKKELA